VMKPLATPVLGGMVSSLLHVLIVTPVIFYSLRARALEKQEIGPVGLANESEEPGQEQLGNGEEIDTR